MLDKEAKKELLLYLYRKMKEEGASKCLVSDIVREIPGSDKKQILRIATALSRKAFFYVGSDTLAGGDYISNLSYTGIEYVEENYPREVSIRPTQSSGPVTVATQAKVRFLRRYRPVETHSILKDMQSEPCFDVDTLAGCFVNLMKDVSESKNDNVAMLGIFAPWGRGKSYFFDRVKRQLPKERFDVVEFNAWKYQETPALWAYLFESFFRRCSWLFRLGFTIKRRASSLAFELLIFSLPFFISFFLGKGPQWIVAGGGLLAFLLRAIAEHGDYAKEIIRKQSKGISFASELGVQAEVEKELEKLLRFWICKRNVGKKTVVLYVDDIDRCDNKRMVSIIDSLRTVLENEEIRKRLLVVCSVDCNKLLKAIQIQYREVMTDDDEQRQVLNAHDQLDKLFLCSLSLPKLDIDDELEFLEKLSGESLSRGETVADNKQAASVGGERAEGVKEEDPLLSRAEMVIWIADNVKNTNLSLSPRAIRHIYYRCLLAMNVMHSIHAGITVEVVEQIIQQSYGYETEIKFNDTYDYGYIVNMVVPYAYPRRRVQRAKNSNN